MTIPSIITNNSIKFLSGLANNSDSIAPMAVKDTISNCAIVATYQKDGDKYDAAEKAIEEFGTGAFWLFGIPSVKAILNKTLYPLLKLNPNFDIRNLRGKSDDEVKNLASKIKNEAKSCPILESEAKIFSTLNENNEVLKSFKNKDLYKGLFGLKFVAATALSAVALSKIIKYKQKTTEKRIQKEFENNSASGILIKKSVDKSNIHDSFCGKLNSQKSNTPSFKGVGDLFMYNPIANTLLLDGVIATTRLKEARKGERKEVAFKEAFQMLFIYCLAKPIQTGFEAIGKHFNMPVELDPKVLFDKNIKENVEGALETVKKYDLNNEKNLISKIHEIASNNPKDALVDLLSKNNVIKIVEDKNTKAKAVSYLNKIDEDEIKKTISNIQELSKNISNISSIKAYKTASVLANIIISALAIGIVQPKLNILMRKLLNNGDNRNPAIVAKEEEMKQNNVKFL